MAAQAVHANQRHTAAMEYAITANHARAALVTAAPVLARLTLTAAVIITTYTGMTLAATEAALNHHAFMAAQEIRAIQLQHHTVVMVYAIMVSHA